jgi:hypothetical protein
MLSRENCIKVSSGFMNNLYSTNILFNQIKIEDTLKINIIRNIFPLKNNNKKSNYEKDEKFLGIITNKKSLIVKKFGEDYIILVEGKIIIMDNFKNYQLSIGNNIYSVKINLEKNKSIILKNEIYLMLLKKELVLGQEFLQLSLAFKDLEYFLSKDTINNSQNNIKKGKINIC